MKFSVGLNFENDAFVDAVIKYKNEISEVYFSWGAFPNGRSDQLRSENLPPWQMQSKQIEALEKMHNEGISFNLLFNANCYGVESQSWSLFNRIGEVVDYVLNEYSLSCVTTTSPLIAKFIKANFENVEVRASVNMEIGTVEGMEYLSDYFDSFYIKRECNHDFAHIEKLYNYAQEEGKKLCVLANSGCLNNCSAHVFHDNLVAHESEISKMNNAYNFTGICKEFLSNEQNYPSLISRLNFIRPEDIDKYEAYFVSAKLATRIHPTPVQVLESYVKRKYSGDVLRLLEPTHSIYPYVIENGEPLALKKIHTDVGML